MMTIKLEINGNLLTAINIQRMMSLDDRDASGDKKPCTKYIYRYSFGKIEWEAPMSGRGDIVHDINDGAEVLAEKVLGHINEGLKQK